MMNAKKKALGRGLSALLNNDNEDNQETNLPGSNSPGNLSNISVSKIESNPYQPRTDFETKALDELSESIKAQGIIQPITVRKTGFDKYQLISGERRLKAATLAGLTEIPAYIRVADDAQMLEMALVENIQRQDLNSIEIAISFQRMMDELNYTQEQLSEKVSKNRSTVTNYLRLLKLPPELQVALRDDQISMGHARALINIEDTQTQLAILKNILSKGLSVRDVEQIVQNLNKQPVRGSKPKKEELPERYLNMKSQLEDKLGSKIDLNRTRKGKGSITIPFQTDDELEWIVKQLII